MTAVRRRIRLPAIALIAASVPATGQACEPVLAGEAAGVLRSAARAVAYRIEPKDIAIGAHFAVELAVCATRGAMPVESLAVDADMPAHRHGMNYRATIVTLGGERYRAEGLMFHMPGRWRLIIELRAGDGVERLTDELVVE